MRCENGARSERHSRVAAADAVAVTSRACSCQLLLKTRRLGWNWYLTFYIRRFFYCDDDTKLLSRQNPHSNCHNPLDFRLTRFIFSCAWCKQVKASWTHEKKRWEMKIGRISEMFSITDDISAKPGGGGSRDMRALTLAKILIQTQTHKLWVTWEVLKMWELLEITLRRSKLALLCKRTLILHEGSEDLLRFSLISQTTTRESGEPSESSSVADIIFEERTSKAQQQRLVFSKLNLKSSCLFKVFSNNFFISEDF